MLKPENLTYTVSSGSMSTTNPISFNDTIGCNFTPIYTCLLFDNTSCPPWIWIDSLTNKMNVDTSDPLNVGTKSVVI